MFPRATPDSKTDHIRDLVGKQKDNDEGFNKHTRRIIQNNNNYLLRNRNLGSRYEGMISQRSQEFVGSGRTRVDEGAEMIRTEKKEEADIIRRAEEEEEDEETEEASGRQKMVVTRVTSPDKIYLQTPAQVAAAQNISRMLEEEILFSQEVHPSIVKMKMNANPDPGLQVGGNYAAHIFDKWLRVTVSVQIPDSDEVTILLGDYHIYHRSCPVLNIFDLPERLSFNIIPAAVRYNSQCR